MILDNCDLCKCGIYIYEIVDGYVEVILFYHKKIYQISHLHVIISQGIV